MVQIRGLIGPQGVLPAREYLQAVAQSGVAHVRFWYAPSLLWISSGSGMLMALCWIGNRPGGLLERVDLVHGPHTAPAAHLAAVERGGRGRELLASRHARDLLRLLSLIHIHGAGFLGIPVRRHAARGGLRLLVLCAARIASGAWGEASAFCTPATTTPAVTGDPAFARQLISVAVGVVSHLFRIGNREARER